MKRQRAFGSSLPTWKPKSLDPVREQDCLEHNIDLVATLNPTIGDENATQIAQQAQASGRGVAQFALADGLLGRTTLPNPSGPSI